MDLHSVPTRTRFKLQLLPEFENLPRVRSPSQRIHLSTIITDDHVPGIVSARGRFVGRRSSVPLVGWRSRLARFAESGKRRQSELVLVDFCVQNTKIVCKFE